MLLFLCVEVRLFFFFTERVGFLLFVFLFFHLGADKGTFRYLKVTQNCVFVSKYIQHKNK